MFSLSWDSAAAQALEQTMCQAPVPRIIKGQVKKQIEKAAENSARAAGHSSVTAEDLMQGLLANMPADMRGKIEEAMKKGPAGLQNLAKDFDNIT
ncbi:MAG: PCP reductase family protein [bacterium]